MSAIVSTSAARVAENTDPEINRRIREEMQTRIARYAANPEGISDRLEELDREWDIERAIEANAASIGLAGLALGVTVHKSWLAIPALVTGFLLQHALQGWCPPVPVLRRMGFRTADEINQERYALKALRGDMDLAAQGSERTSAALRAVELR